MSLFAFCISDEELAAERAALAPADRAALDALPFRYEVQTYTVCDGWVNCWSDDEDKPTTFATELEAETAITEHLADVAEAVLCGEMAEEYSRDDYRVVPIK